MASNISEANPTKNIPSNGQNGTAETAPTKGLARQNGSGANQSNDASAQSQKALNEAKKAHVAKANEHLLRAWKLISQHKDSNV